MIFFILIFIVRGVDEIDEGYETVETLTSACRCS